MLSSARLLIGPGAGRHLRETTGAVRVEVAGQEEGGAGSLADGRAGAGHRARGRTDQGASAPGSAAPTCTSAAWDGWAQQTINAAARARPRVRRRGRRRSAVTSPTSRSATGSAVRATWCAASAATAWPAAATCAAPRSASASAATARSPSTWRCPRPTCGCTASRVDLDVAAIFDPFGNAVHTALSFPLVGEDVLITGAGPIGLMAAAVARHAGARNVVITDVSEERLELARKIGVSLALNVADSHHRRGRSASSGCARASTSAWRCPASPAAMRDMIANMTHGGRIAMLGLPVAGVPGRLGPDRHLHDHDQGHLRPRDVRDLVRDVGAPRGRPRPRPGDHRPVRLPRLRGRLRRRGERPRRQGHPRLDR